MADGQHGGYHRPSNPAPVSNPGRESARTDRGPRQMDITGGSYGSSQEFQQQQSAAPLAPPAGAPGGSAPAPAAMPTPLHAPTEFADQPVTSGADAGAGLSAAEIGLGRSQDDALRSRVGPLLPALMRMADSQYASDAFRQQVRALAAKIL